MRFVQAEGGSPGAPEISFLYELGIDEFVQNMVDLLSDPNDVASKKGVFGGYIDYLYWAATFDKMVQAIEFVIERGPAYGYNLNMKKCVYLMAPTAKKHTVDELRTKLATLIAMGILAQKIKIHPDCQCGLPAEVVANRKAEWDIKILGAFIGTDDYIMSALRRKMEDIRIVAVSKRASYI